MQRKLSNKEKFNSDLINSINNGFYELNQKNNILKPDNKIKFNYRKLSENAPIQLKKTNQKEKQGTIQEDKKDQQQNNQYVLTNKLSSQDPQSNSKEQYQNQNQELEAQNQIKFQQNTEQVLKEQAIIQKQSFVDKQPLLKSDQIPQSQIKKNNEEIPSDKNGLITNHQYLTQEQGEKSGPSKQPNNSDNQSSQSNNQKEQNSQKIMQEKISIFDKIIENLVVDCSKQEKQEMIYQFLKRVKLEKYAYLYNSDELDQNKKQANFKLQVEQLNDDFNLFLSKNFDEEIKKIRDKQKLIPSDQKIIQKYQKPIHPLTLEKKFRQNQNQQTMKVDYSPISNYYYYDIPNKNIKDLKFTKEYLKPIDIVWELGLLEKQIDSDEALTQYQNLQIYFKKATQIVQTYINVHQDTMKDICLKEGKIGTSLELKKQINYKADLVIVAKFFEKSDFLNQDKIKYEQANADRLIRHIQTNRIFLGLININQSKIPNFSQSLTVQNLFIFTLVHEIFHLLGLKNTQNYLQFKDIDSSLSYLLQAKKQGIQLIDQSHLRFETIPNEVMNSFKSFNEYISIYTLEIIEHYCPVYKTNKDKIIKNYTVDSIDQVQNIFNYKCQEDQEISIHKNFCTRKQSESKQVGCSADYKQLTICSEIQLANSCYRNIDLENYNCMDDSILNNIDNLSFSRGQSSRCFEVNDGIARCLKFQVVQNKQLFIIVNEKKFECKKSNKLIIINYKDEENQQQFFQLKCPDIDDFIQKYNETTCPYQCHNNGVCQNGKCICYHGYSEQDNCQKEIDSKIRKDLFTHFLFDQQNYF